MTIEINWLAVALATVVGTIIAGIWYQDIGFGRPWRQLTGVSKKDSQKAGNTPMVILLVANFITALIVAISIHITSTFFADSSVWHALLVGFVAWLAFSATTLATHNTFEQKPLKLTLINHTYQLTIFLAIALVIGLFSA